MNKHLAIPWVLVVPIVTSLLVLGGFWADMRITLNNQTELLLRISATQDAHNLRIIRLENGNR